MPFCSNCGTNVESRFCLKCGAPAGVSAAGEGTANSAAAVPASAGMTDNGAGALCYVGGLITGVLFLAIAPYNQKPAVRFHAYQSILFHLSWIALLIGEMILGIVLPFALSLLVSLLGLLVWGGGFLLWLYLMWKAFENQRVVL